MHFQSKLLVILKSLVDKNVLAFFCSQLFLYLLMLCFERIVLGSQFQKMFFGLLILLL